MGIRMTARWIAEHAATELVNTIFRDFQYRMDCSLSAALVDHFNAWIEAVRDQGNLASPDQAGIKANIQASSDDLDVCFWESTQRGRDVWRICLRLPVMGTFTGYPRNETSYYRPGSIHRAHGWLENQVVMARMLHGARP